MALVNFINTSYQTLFESAIVADVGEDTVTVLYNGAEYVVEWVYNCPNGVEVTEPASAYTVDDSVVIELDKDRIPQRVVGHDDGARACGFFIKLIRGDGTLCDDVNLFPNIDLQDSEGNDIGITQEYDEDTQYWEITINDSDDIDSEGYFLSYACEDGLSTQYPGIYTPSEKEAPGDLIQPGRYEDEIPYWKTEGITNFDDNDYSSPDDKYATACINHVEGSFLYVTVYRHFKYDPLYSGTRVISSVPFYVRRRIGSYTTCQRGSTMPANCTPWTGHCIDCGTFTYHPCGNPSEFPPYVYWTCEYPSCGGYDQDYIYGCGHGICTDNFTSCEYGDQGAPWWEPCLIEDSNNFSVVNGSISNSFSKGSKHCKVCSGEKPDGLAAISDVEATHPATLTGEDIIGTAQSSNNESFVPYPTGWFHVDTTWNKDIKDAWPT